MGCPRMSFLLTFLISVFHLHDVGGHYPMSPSPSPPPSPSPSPATQPQRLPCHGVPDKSCDIDNYNITACVSLGNGSQVPYIAIINNGESSIQLDIIVHEENFTLTISGDQVKKVNLPSNLGGNSSILVKVGNGECTIQLGALLPKGFNNSYMMSATGAHLLFAAVLFIGGGLVCYKLVKRRKVLDGIPYQELEMEQRESGSTMANERHNRWDDQNWDDEWDEEKAAWSVS